MDHIPRTYTKFRILQVMTLIFLISCGSAPQVESLQSVCTKTHPKVGLTAVLETRHHNVSGIARIVDNCTIEIEKFTYDGGGLDVRVWGAKDGGKLSEGKRLTNDIRRSSGYQSEKLTVTLPTDVTLDDINWISIWCVAVSMSFGDGEFR